MLGVLYGHIAEVNEQQGMPRSAHPGNSHLCSRTHCPPSAETVYLQHFDKDNNGTLTRDELEDALRSSTLDDLQLQVDIDKVLAECDKSEYQGRLQVHSRQAFQLTHSQHFCEVASFPCYLQCCCTACLPVDGDVGHASVNHEEGLQQGLQHYVTHLLAHPSCACRW